MTTVTVSQLNRYIKAVLDEDKRLTGLFVRGEIFNFVRHQTSGHCYFSLRDAGGSVRAVLFKSYAQDLRFSPENGMAVLVQASVSVYERDGTYQLYVTDMQPDGAGALAVAFEQCRARLAAQGLFDARHKKPLPAFPSVIGVVTSENGAALHDIVQVISRRYPLCTLRLCPAAVQGRDAPASLVRALQTLEASGECDVILLARGGGSAEDLWGFNDEALARAVFAARTPVVSAVGHETDYTICDFVADLRAPTPSAAAELVTPSAEELRAQLAGVRQRLGAAMRGLLRNRQRRLEALAAHRALRTPMEYVYSRQQRLDFLTQSLYNRKNTQFARCRQRLENVAALLDSLSPLRVLHRGYCVALRGEHVVTTAGALVPGEALCLRFEDGSARAAVLEVSANALPGAMDAQERDVAKNEKKRDI